MHAMMFPGQGSQRPGMGEDLFDLADYTAIEPQVDALLGYSLRARCLDKAYVFSGTDVTQPCLYMVNALHGIRVLRSGVQIGCVAGHSLGEYNALQAAGVFDLLTGLRLVHKRGTLMAQARGGAMTAVLGLSSATIVDLMLGHGLDMIDVANYNAPAQTVISGPEAEVAQATRIFESAGATACIRLPVSGAFHSRLMETAARAFAGFIDAVDFQRPQIPVISNVTGTFYPAKASSAVIASLLVRQIVRPVLWVKCVHSMLDAGATDFVEAGPGNVLMRLIPQIRAVGRTPAVVH
ncbi:ACP S-malonyltransferase [Xanthomonas maliensis]|uniref:ACP S-malonyltransferase n=1 Tax=Xanthomonas maliensis TaxID=1321368 RepID=UPI0003AAC434|nr:ACP S-malonyltransferase [Xanthomonas maliensis]KAB7766668.1 [acyl-carrier-protein] S-malonyltransferase [Xanthomonas maliensis]